MEKCTSRGEDSVVQKSTVALSTLLKENDKSISDLKIKEKNFYRINSFWS